MREIVKRTIPNLTEEQCDKFIAYYEMLVDWNSRMNLTAITDPEEVAQKHFLDSLAALPLLRSGDRLVDVGTGAGFPSVPLLIVKPDLKVTLVDSLNKRITFLTALLQTLGLTAACIHARAEELGRNAAHREQYDVAVTRAVAPLSVLLELTVPLLRVGGRSIAYKGNAAEETEQAKRACHLLHASIEVSEVEADYGKRTLLICTKNAPTPKTYPRKAGTPSKQPL